MPLTIIFIDNIRFFFVKELKWKFPIIFKRASSRYFSHDNLTPRDTIYAHKKNDVWIKSSKYYSKSLLIIKRLWVVKNIDGFYEETNDLEYLPDYLDISDKYKIKIVGKQNRKKIYFNVSSLEKRLKRENFDGVILSNQFFNKEIDYIFFNENNLKELYLTWVGLLKIIKIKNLNKHFEMLFKVKLSTSAVIFSNTFNFNNSQIKLGSKYLGVDNKTISNVLDKNAQDLNCIYFYEIGKMNDVLEKIDINICTQNVGTIIYKLGFTKDFEKVDSDIKSEYYNFNTKIILIKKIYIDPQYLSQGFQHIENILKIYSKIIDGYVSLKPKIVQKIKDEMVKVSNSYCGHYRKILLKNKNLKEENEKLKRELKIMKLKYKRELNKNNDNPFSN